MASLIALTRSSHAIIPSGESIQEAQDDSPSSWKLFSILKKGNTTRGLVMTIDPISCLDFMMLL